MKPCTDVGTKSSSLCQGIQAFSPLPVLSLPFSNPLAGPESTLKDPPEEQIME